MILLFKSLAYKEGCKEHENVSLNSTVKNVEVHTEHHRDDETADMFNKLHNNERTKNVSEKTHTKRKRSYDDLHDVYGKHNGHRLEERLQKALEAAVSSVGSHFDEDNTQQRKCYRNIDVLGRRLYAEADKTYHVGDTHEEQNGTEIGNVSSAGLSHIALEEFVDEFHAHFKESLWLSGNDGHFSGHEQHGYHNNRHEAPHDYNRFMYSYRPDNGNINGNGENRTVFEFVNKLFSQIHHILLFRIIISAKFGTVIPFIIELFYHFVKHQEKVYAILFHNRQKFLF